MIQFERINVHLIIFIIIFMIILGGRDYFRIISIKSNNEGNGKAA